MVWLPRLFVVDEPPASETLWSRVSILLMFGGGTISSSKLPAPSALGMLECGVPKTVLPFRTLRSGENSSPRCWTGSWRLELGVVRGFRLEAALEGGWRAGHVIRQSAGEVDRARVGVPFLLLENAVGSGFRIGVRERSKVRRTGDWSRPVRTDPVLFLLIPAQRVPDVALPELDGQVPPSC